jgi:hypothetical protein
MPQDPFKSTGDSLTAPADHCYAITPDDVQDVAVATKAIYVGTSGDVAVETLANPTPVTFRNVPQGAILDIRVSRVLATGTTAADIVGLA